MSPLYNPVIIPFSKDKVCENIMKSNSVKLVKEDGYDLHLESTNSTFPERNRKEQKRIFDDAEILNNIHDRMFATVFIQRFHEIQDKIKQFAHPDKIGDFTKSCLTNWVKPIDLGSGELWEKYQKDGEVW